VYWVFNHRLSFLSDSPVAGDLLAHRASVSAQGLWRFPSPQAILPAHLQHGIVLPVSFFFFFGGTGV
jgi:hypothetical protein